MIKFVVQELFWIMYLNYWNIFPTDRIEDSLGIVDSMFGHLKFDVRTFVIRCSDIWNSMFGHLKFDQTKNRLTRKQHHHRKMDSHKWSIKCWSKKFTNKIEKYLKSIEKQQNYHGNYWLVFGSIQYSLFVEIYLFVYSIK